jgi:hypothetical protein
MRTKKMTHQHLSEGLITIDQAEVFLHGMFGHKDLLLEKASYLDIDFDNNYQLTIPYTKDSPSHCIDFLAELMVEMHQGTESLTKFIEKDPGYFFLILDPTPELYGVFEKMVAIHRL